MSGRRPVDQRPRRLTREDRNNKVTLQSVELVVNRCKCSRKCLSKVSQLDILTYRYRAWKPNKFEERRKWVLSMLQEAKIECSEPGGRTTFNTKLAGHKVCNSCYADAIGYSQRQFKYLKRSILTHNRSSGAHGNSDRSREFMHVAACRSVMEAIFHECGCPQPHRHAKRLSSKEWKEVRLLPMNTKREDILAMVNRRIAAMGATKKVSKARFNRMWAEEFTEVRIPPTSRFSKCQIC